MTYDYIITKPPLDEDTLAHYGVKGMKWKVRRKKKITSNGKGVKTRHGKSHGIAGEKILVQDPYSGISYYVPASQYSSADVNLYELFGITTEEHKRIIKEVQEKYAKRKEALSISKANAKKYISNEMSNEKNRKRESSKMKSKLNAKKHTSSIK